MGILLITIKITLNFLYILKSAKLDPIIYFILD